MQTLALVHGEREADNLFRYVLDRYNEVEEEELKQIMRRLKAHEPIQYILGKADFYDLELLVNESVLIPRPETEELVDWVIKSETDIQSVLDIGTGSGCIPLALKRAWPEADVWGMDVSEAALEVAKNNAYKYDLGINWIRADILNKKEWPEHRWDIIVSNPPYIPHAERHLLSANVLEHEPHLALFVENDDPLIFYDVISSYAQMALTTGGRLYFELNEFNAEAAKQRLINKGFKEVQLQKDMSGKTRMLRAEIG